MMNLTLNMFVLVFLKALSLGPFLFVIADNTTTLWKRDKNIEGLLYRDNQAMKITFEWFKLNYLVVIDNKTIVIDFSRDYTTIYNNVKPIKLLGVFLDIRLICHFHIDYLCAQLASTTYLLRKL